MPKKSAAPKTVATVTTAGTPGNAKVCEHCGEVNSFRRVKCDKCGALLPEGKFERSRRMREQSLRRERQLALTSNLFKEKPLVPDEMDDVVDLDQDLGRHTTDIIGEPDTDGPEPPDKTPDDADDD